MSSTDDWDEFGCPVCGADIITAVGPKNAAILLVSEEPTESEMNEGTPFVGQVAGVLRTEMAFCGIDLRGCRRMILCQHPLVKGNTKQNENCLLHGMEEVVKEAGNREIVVLLGSKTVQLFCNESVSAVSGLPITSQYFSAIAFPCIAPGSVFAGGVGELRFAMRELAKLVETLGLDTPKQKSKPVVEEVEDW